MKKCGDILLQAGTYRVSGGRCLQWSLNCNNVQSVNRLSRTCFQDSEYLLFIFRLHVECRKQSERRSLHIMSRNMYSHCIAHTHNSSLCCRVLSLIGYPLVSFYSKCQQLQPYILVLSHIFLLTKMVVAKSLNLKQLPIWVSLLISNYNAHIFTIHKSLHNVDNVTNLFCNHADTLVRISKRTFFLIFWTKFENKSSKNFCMGLSQLTFSSRICDRLA